MEVKGGNILIKYEMNKEDVFIFEYNSRMNATFQSVKLTNIDDLFLLKEVLEDKIRQWKIDNHNNINGIRRKHEIQN